MFAHLYRRRCAAFRWLRGTSVLLEPSSGECPQPPQAILVLTCGINKNLASARQSSTPTFFMGYRYRLGGRRT
ncbi:hypothetical protein BD410DRAFT_796617 [Rickenella mellea]|uniref:Uncharacterized protein n=1 Tax=Rickenella mellea TaxID=50990 RepID=A0A4Y7PI68_9AGAM|nr:hypothetical protein BD410DRAFT_796617 [Rickenella mellea]